MSESVEFNVMTVTIPLDEYRDLLTKCARFDLLEEQKKAHEAEMEAWRKANSSENAV